MPHIHLTVDGNTLLHGDMQTNTEALTAFVKSTDYKPWLQAAVGELAHSALKDRDTTIEIHTAPNGYRMAVGYQ